MNNYLHGYIKRSGFHQGMALMILIVMGLGVWGWFMSIKLDQIKVTGTESAEAVDIKTLASLSEGERLFHIDAAQLSSRVEQHPWVLEAHISRFPTGTLRIKIVERKPVVLVLNSSGRPAFFLDRDGIRLPLAVERAYDVPVFHGYSDGFSELGETSNSTVREFLRVLADDVAGTADMISEVRLDSKTKVESKTRSAAETKVTADLIELRLEPLGNHGAVPVVLGSSKFEQKFNMLHAFWYQAMLPGQEQDFGWIDLRYDSQIVVRDAAP